MQLTRSVIALDPRLFGKGRVRVASSDRKASSTLGADVKLFATTFLAGFVVVSMLIS